MSSITRRSSELTKFGQEKDGHVCRGDHIDLDRYLPALFAQLVRRRRHTRVQDSGVDDGELRGDLFHKFLDRLVAEHVKRNQLDDIGLAFCVLLNLYLRRLAAV